MPKKKTDKDQPDINKELKGFNIEINEFGEIKTNMEIDKLNSFLNENLEDKKLKVQKESETSSKEEDEEES